MDEANGLAETTDRFLIGICLAKQCHLSGGGSQEGELGKWEFGKEALHKGTKHQKNDHNLQEPRVE